MPAEWGRVMRTGVNVSYGSPDIVMPIEERARLEQQKTEAARAAKPQRATEAS